MVAVEEVVVDGNGGGGCGFYDSRVGERDKRTTNLYVFRDITEES